VRARLSPIAIRPGRKPRIPTIAGCDDPILPEPLLRYRIPACAGMTRQLVRRSLRNTTQWRKPVQINPRKTKENQAKPSKKAWISLDSFGRIGTFQCVTAIPNKKISLGLNSRLRLLVEGISRAFLTSCPGVQTSLIRSSYRRSEMVKTLQQGIRKKSRHWLIILMGGIMAGAAAVSPRRRRSENPEDHGHLLSSLHNSALDR
jgi:hypothetical protein